MCVRDWGGNILAITDGVWARGCADGLGCASAARLRLPREGLLRSARLKLLCAAPATLPPLVQLVLVLVALSDPISRCVGVGRGS